MIAAGIRNGRLEFNLGNALLQAGDLGRAILHYRRAERLIPGDPYLADNLSLARSRRLISIPPARSTRLLHSVFFWHYDTAAASRARLALVAYVLLWGLLTARCFARRRWLLVAAVACGVLAAGLGVSAGVTNWAQERAPEGVVLEMDVPVYKGPGAGYQRQFEQALQPGVEFVLRERRGDWWRVELPDGKHGWIGSTTAELVP